eukprot:c45209_g1_i1 orf=3-179(-)
MLYLFDYLAAVDLVNLERLCEILKELLEWGCYSEDNWQHEDREAIANSDKSVYEFHLYL